MAKKWYQSKIILLSIIVILSLLSAIIILSFKLSIQHIVTSIKAIPSLITGRATEEQKIYTPTEYQPLKTRFKKKILKRMRTLKQKYETKKIKIIIGLDMSKNGHSEIADFLIEIFALTSISLEIDQDHSSISTDSKPIYSWSSQANKDYINDLCWAISPLFDLDISKNSYSLEARRGASKKILLNFKKSFKFRENGKVYFD